MKKHLVASLMFVIAVCGCRADGISDYFDAALADKAPYRLPGVTGRDLRAYEIVQRTKELVVVRSEASSTRDG